ncbi:hypothetical protein ACFQJD_15980 [Haloplanus sp. GCM10025708]|uniref:hypothetical protein n=1 Tax=Haloplanus sp. GCM10025708 TaxID=3252679 RepID=UPI0036133B61
MAFRADDRGQAIQVGAVLLLAILILSLSLAQVEVVPQANEEIEFRHSLDVQNDVVNLRSAVLQSGTSSDVRPTTISMGTTYPNRIVLVNPPPPGGRLTNGTDQRFEIANARAINNETGDYVNDEYGFRTKTISYRPEYNYYQSAPTTSVESGVVVNRFDDGDAVPISSQVLVRGNDIYFVAVTGNVSRAQVRDFAVDPRSLSTSTRPTTITNQRGEDLTLTVPTSLTATQWDSLLDEQSAVQQVTAAGGNKVNITLNGGENYRLRTAKVAVGTGGTMPRPAYLTRIGPYNVTPVPNEELVVELRDGYSNPIPPPRSERSLRSDSRTATRTSWPTTKPRSAPTVALGSRTWATARRTPERHSCSV